MYKGRNAKMLSVGVKNIFLYVLDVLTQIDVSFYLHCTTNLWHMCQFFSAKIRLIIE